MGLLLPNTIIEIATAAGQIINKSKANTNTNKA